MWNFQLSEIEIDLKIIKLKFTKGEVEDILQDVLAEMREITKDITRTDRSVLERIMAHPDDVIVVWDLFPKFKGENASQFRGSDEHQLLRKLRDAQFVRPDPRGQWHSDSRIAIKPFGKLLWDKVGPETLFPS